MTETETTENSNIGLTFKEQVGLPEKEHAKKLAREKKKAEKAKKENPVFEEKVYTLKGDKIVYLTITPSGTHSGYVGRKSKLKKDEYEAHVKQWKSEGVWIIEDDFEEKIREIKKRVVGKYEAWLKTK